jgi:O-antigen/teichoic acid export membrane protein
MDIARTTLLTFLAQGGSAASIFLGFMIFTKLLGPEEFGVFVLFLGAVNVLTLFSELGVNGAVKKRLSESTGNSNVLTAGLLIKAVLLCLLTAAVMIGKSLLNDYFGTKIAAWIVCGVFVQQIGDFFVDCLKGELRVPEAEGATFIRNLLFILLGIIGSFARATAVALLIAYIVSWAVLIPWLFYRMETRPGAFRLTTVRSIYDFAKYDAISSVISKKLYSWVDVLVIGFFLSATYVTAYEIAWRIAGMVMLLSRSIGFTIFPSVSRLHAEEERSKIEDLVPPVIFGALLIVIPSIGGVYVLSTNLLTILFTSELAIAAPALLILTIGKIPQSMNMIFGQFLQGINRPDLTVVPTAVASILNLIMNLVLVGEIGLVGAAIATVGSMCVSLALVLRNVSKVISIRFPLQRLSHIVGFAAIMTAVVEYADSVVSTSNIIELIAIIGCGVAVYFGLFIALTDSGDQIYELFLPE